MAYREHIRGTNHDVVLAFNKEIENAEQAMYDACYTFVKTAVDLLNKKANDLIGEYYKNYDGNGDGYPANQRGGELYKSLYPYCQDNLNRSGRVANKGQDFTVYGGLKVSADNMRDYRNVWMKKPRYTEASRVLGWTLLNEENGYHGWYGSHPGPQKGRQYPIKTEPNFLQEILEYYESDGLQDKAEGAAMAATDTAFFVKRG